MNGLFIENDGNSQFMELRGRRHVSGRYGKPEYRGYYSHKLEKNSIPLEKSLSFFS